KQARQTCDKVIVSVFVNPVQFGPNEDYDKYPRTLDSDHELCGRNGVDVIFAPTPSEMYPDQKLTKIVPPIEYQGILCGKSRPGHFDGVALVVTKLFNITQADVAFFGQKDAQQFIIIKKFVQDLNIPIELVRCPIIRDEDGLAMSSRNTYLSDKDREKALCLNKMLSLIQEFYDSGELSIEKVKNEAVALVPQGVEVEYFEFVSSDDLEPKMLLEDGTLVAIAVKLNNIRLIDNIILEKKS
ncbi:MAG: pantoate--beta-alanine ligase, partial [Candidatus Gastranaerophilales bacterium]|nr:pantoate--beta-alanine ligase [Candidatus Gastranaerophilales bacterium]